MCIYHFMSAKKVQSQAFKNITEASFINKVLHAKRHLISVKFDVYHRHPLICLAVMSCYTISCLRDVLKDQIEIELILFCSREETVLEWDNIGMIKKPHRLQFTVLVSLILQDLFYSNSLSCFQALCLHKSKDLKPLLDDIHVKNSQSTGCLCTNKNLTIQSRGGRLGGFVSKSIRVIL